MIAVRLPNGTLILVYGKLFIYTNMRKACISKISLPGRRFGGSHAASGGFQPAGISIYQ
jgi:hypothetical protein